MRLPLERLLREEDGQDLIEYAFLTAFIGLAGAGVFNLIADAIGDAYVSWDNEVQGAWEPCNPGETPPC